MIKINTGKDFENDVFDIIMNLITNNKFLVSLPNVYVYQQKEYYSKDRESYIKVDISIEKHLGNKEVVPPSLIIILECKDYKGFISVSEIEEFHSKLQQIGADNTKGIFVTRNGAFQKSALNYAKSKGIGLIRIMPDNQVNDILYCITISNPILWYFFSPLGHMSLKNKYKKALMEVDYISCDQHYISGWKWHIFIFDKKNRIESIERYLFHLLLNK